MFKFVKELVNNAKQQRCIDAIEKDFHPNMGGVRKGTDFVYLDKCYINCVERYTMYVIHHDGSWKATLFKRAELVKILKVFGWEDLL